MGAHSVSRTIHRIIRTIVPAIVCLCYIVSAVAQEQPRPRIALVLIGSGERSVSEIGVIKALEQLRVPIDVVVGTGMGAVIGAAYASGLSATELEELFAQWDWANLMSDVPVTHYLDSGCALSGQSDSQPHGDDDRRVGA